MGGKTMLTHTYIDEEIKEKKEWALRRQLGISNDRQLLVITCMDERIPIYEALGISDQDAHVFRNAGGIITDDVIRSAMLSIHFFGTKEIIIVNHTECEMMALLGSTVVDALEYVGIDIASAKLNPALPELQLHDQKKHFEQWVGMFENVDEICLKQIRLLRESPFIPKQTVINGYIWQVESMSLRRPHEKVHTQVNTNKETRAK